MRRTSVRPIRWTTGCPRSRRGHRDRRLVVEIKVVDKGAGEAAADDDERRRVEVKAEAKEEEDADSNAPTSDPVRTYMRKMGSILAAHARGEVEISPSAVEDGDRRVLQVVLNSSRRGSSRSSTWATSCAAGIRVKEVVKDVDDEDPSSTNSGTSTCLAGDRQGPSLWKADAGTNKKKQEILDALLEMRLNKKQIDKIVVLLKEFVERVEEGPSRDRRLRAQVGLSLKEFLKTLREIRSSPMRQRAVSKKLGLRPKRSRRWLRSSPREEEDKEGRGEAKLTETVLRATMSEIPERRARGGKARRR